MLMSMIPLFKQDILSEGSDGSSSETSSETSSGVSEDSSSVTTTETKSSVGEGVSWDSLKEMIPEEYRQEASLKNVSDFSTLVKNYVHAQKQIGRDKIPVPDKHASEEDWRKVYTKLGLPEKIEEYSFNHGLESENDFVKGFKEQAYAMGILPHQAEKIFGFFRDQSVNTLESRKAQAEEFRKSSEESLKKEWGEAYSDNLVKARVAFKELVPDEKMRSELVDLGLGDNPAFIKMLSNASKFFKEDVFIGQGAGKFTSLTPEDALQRAKDIQGNPEHAYRNPSHPNHASAKKEVADLYKLAFPE